MALVSFLPAQRVDVPHEPGEWFEFRKPSSRVVREARKVVEAEGRRGVRDFGAEIVRAFNEGDDDEKAARRARRLAQLQEYDPDQFDRQTLLEGAIVAWSYTDGGQGLPVTPTRIADLDEQTAQWAHVHVVGLMRPPTPEAEKSAGAAAPPAS